MLDRRSLRRLLGAAALSLAACYQGGEEVGKEAPPGYPGGWCYATLSCEEPAWLCEPEGLYCYDPADPCSGVYCGWNGTCAVTENNLPSCICDPGASNEEYALFCTPSDGAGAASF